MKKLFLLVLLLPFAAVAQQGECPLPDGCYTDRLIYEIIGPDGAVVDRTVYERNVGLSYNEAMALKYVRMLRNIQGGAKSFFDVLQHGTASEAAKKALE